MSFHSTSTPILEASSDCVVVGLFSDKPAFGSAAALDAASDGAISQLAQSGDISTAAGKTTLLPRLSGVAGRVLVVGLGESEKLDRLGFQKAAAATGQALVNHPATEIHCYITEVEIADEAWRVRTAATAIDASQYLYSHTKKSPETYLPLAKVHMFATHNVEQAIAQAEATNIGVNRARELANLPPNICNPAYFAQIAREIEQAHDSVSLEVLDETQMQELGMGALLAVGQGSANRPHLIVLRYNGAGDDVAPHALVGKGITFDTGGISLKPGPAMDEMKFDMGGAASVIGAFEACVTLGLPINLVTVVPAVENMPDGKSYRPGDVVTSMSGQTIEVLNTDAEGRLILCDALTYVQKYNPASIIDVATLTGACIIALGSVASGLMTKHEDMQEELLDAGNKALDRAWPLPLWDDYQPQLDTNFADMANIGGKAAGTITAGCFLSRFTKGQRWAHLDIAGSAWNSGKDKGATGRPVPLLLQYLIDRAG